MDSDCYNITYKNVKIDPYRILKEYDITHPAQAHAIKKLLRCGKSHKDLSTDIQECIDTLVRWRQMLEEDGLNNEVNAKDLMKDWKCEKCGIVHNWNVPLCGCIVPKIPDRCPTCKVGFGLHNSGCENNPI